MRGKVQAFSGKMLHTGITPAYAGKSGFIHDRGSRNKDHPRLCGEKSTARGHAKKSTGITPAYAGKRPLYFSVVGIKRDHPRLCGEKSTVCKFMNCFQGSPPPMRGKAAPETKRGGTLRITPAYAGKRQCRQLPFSKSWDHPRLCGEKFLDFIPQIDPEGSPPPMRGKD